MGGRGGQHPQQFEVSTQTHNANMRAIKKKVKEEFDLIQDIPMNDVYSSTTSSASTPARGDVHLVKV